MASDEHQLIVKGMIDYFRGKGFTIVNADYEGFDECPKVGRHAPDIIAIDSLMTYHIGEAEICDSLNNRDTLEQFDDFSQFSRNGKTYHFYPAVPKSCIADLQSTLQQLGLSTKSNVHPLQFD